MAVDWLLASLHHLAVFSLAAVLAAELALTAGALDERIILRLARIDAWYGVMAGAALAAGVARVFLGAKGFGYYLVNWAFWIKMLLFVVVAALSAGPTVTFMLWRRRVRDSDAYRPARAEVARLRAFLWVEAALFAAIPVAAAAVARGYGM